MKAWADKAVPIGSRLPTDEEQVAANELRAVIAASLESGRSIGVHVMDAEAKTSEIILPTGLSQTLIDLLQVIGQGDAVTVFAIGQRLTTQEAADLLNVSRPHLIKLLERGELAFDLVGKHRRIKASDLFHYKAEHDARRSKTLEELIANDAELI